MEAFIAESLEASLTVKDLEKSLAWYRDVVGFALDRRLTFSSVHAA